MTDVLQMQRDLEQGIARFKELVFSRYGLHEDKYKMWSRDFDAALLDYTKSPQANRSLEELIKANHSDD